jgi:uncharacterized protein YigA (DUF484 family)
MDSVAIAQYLVDHPQFFRRACRPAGRSQAVQPPDRTRRVAAGTPDGSHARQVQRAGTAHGRPARNAEENAEIANRFHGWTQQLLRPGGAELPARRGRRPGQAFHRAASHAAPVEPGRRARRCLVRSGASDDVRLFANSLRAPYCGPNRDFEAVAGSRMPPAVRSTVLPLRASAGSGAFGLLVLGSPDPERFSAGDGDRFPGPHRRTASAALAPLRA